MALPKRSSPTQQLNSTHDLKQRVIACLNKLSDRDTQTIATTELEQIVKSLSHESFSSFLACIYDTDSSEKPPVRKQCVRLLGLLSSTHGEALSPHLTKMISNIIKRLRDSDSVVRSACVDSVTIMSTQITKASSLLVFLKPLMETMLLEQDYNSQMGSALCLSSVIEASTHPEPAQLQRVLPKMVKLLKSESFKAKPALLSVIRSVTSVGGSMNRNGLGNLVSCLVEFLSSEDWAARKAASEALLKLAIVQGDSLSEFKSCCLSTFETRRFDKVKVVRETMNQMIEAWKDVPGSLDESKSSSIDNRSGQCSPSSSVNSNVVGGNIPQTKRKISRRNSFLLSNNPSAMSTKKSSPMKSSTRTPAVLSHNRDHKKPSEWKLEVSLPETPSLGVDCEDNYEKRNEEVQEPGMNRKDQYSEIIDRSHRSLPEGQGNFCSKNNDEKIHKFGGLRSQSRVVPYNDGTSESTVSNDSDEQCGSLRESEDLSLVWKQLLLIENQQSNLMDLLQRFMGSSQNGIRSLETRVNGLEMALGEIRNDLTLSTGRISPSDSAENTCCHLPGADFLSPKFWRKSEGRCSTSRISFAGGNPSLRSMADNDGYAEPHRLENRRFSNQGADGGFVVNPLAAEYQNDMRKSTEMYPNRMSTTISQNAERRQARNGNGI